MANETRSPDDERAMPQLLERLHAGDRAALDALFPMLYEELRVLAHRQRLRWRGDYTLDSTALLHEAYIKLTRQNAIDVGSRAHFLALAATAMRHILFNYAEQRRAMKRGGEMDVVSLGAIDTLAIAEWSGHDDAADLLVALDGALSDLERLNARAGRVVECRFYGGLTIEETAAALEVSDRTVKRDWAFAQAWLQRALQEAGTGG